MGNFSFFSFFFFFFLKEHRLLFLEQMRWHIEKYFRITKRCKCKVIFLLLLLLFVGTDENPL